MSYPRATFCGLSLLDAKLNIGWGGQASTLSLSLVRDLSNGDAPAFPAQGSPVFFSLGALKFGGLLQRAVERKSSSGDTWDVTCVDPREILEGAQLIVGNYAGPTYFGALHNVVNCYGWWEQTIGFGTSLANDAGMPWGNVKTALLNVCDAPAYGPYGGPLTLAGYRYSLDLSDLPLTPAAYRLGGQVVSLLEAISAVCEDAGCDFFVELVGFKIKVRTVPRRDQPPLGTIAAFVNRNTGDVIRNEDGLEFRNEVTSAMLVGGDVHLLQQSDASSSASFWGYDVLGNPIVGTPVTLTFFNQPDPKKPPVALGSVQTEEMFLNATGIADVIGAVQYKCTTLEMRLAMVNYDSWSAYINNHRPDIAKLITSPFRGKGVVQGLVPAKPNVVNDRKDAAKQFGMAAINSDYWSKAQRLYEFVKAYGTDFYGKKFLVGIPFVLSKQDPETLRFGFSMEPADGGWLPEDASPLGLSWLNQEVMKLGDGRYRGFVGFADATGVDTARISPQDSVSEGGKLYLRANVDRNIVFLPSGRPAVLVTFGGAVYEEAQDAYGNFGLVAWSVFALQPRDAQPKLANNAFGNVGCKVWPAARYPDAFAVPLKSNTLTYGPWYVAGAAGKVRVEIDQSMTPWTFGGWAEMDAAGAARVLNAVTNMQVAESGLLELAGAPLCSLGDVLQAGGPNVTGVDVSYGRDGVTTSYRFHTYTPRFGVFGKGLGERIKRMGLTNLELRKSLRASLNNAGALADAGDSAARGFLANAPKAVKMQTPHEVLACHSLQEASGTWRTCPKAMTYEEAVGLAGADDDEAYRGVAVMSLDGLLRPFTTSPSGAPGMPGFAAPSYPTGMNSRNLNPFASGNDVAYLAAGQSYGRLHAYEAGNDPLDTRAVALRGPLVVAGWGYDLQGDPVPGDGSGGFLPETLRRQDAWKAGPVDLLWDQPRGVWTAGGNRMGVTSGAIPAGGSGVVVVSGGNLLAHNPWSVGVSGSLAVAVSWFADTHRWNLIAADCVP